MSDGVWLILMLGWACLVFAGYPLFHGDSPLAFKRRYFAPYLVLLSTLGIVLLTLRYPWSSIVSIPLFGLAAYRQIRETRFCQSCARPSINRRDLFCGRCGERLAE
jgi:hypothetical protein